jgi:hypothetical protein
VTESASPLAGVKVVRPRLRLRALHLDPDSTTTRAREHAEQLAATIEQEHNKKKIPLTRPAPSGM